MEQLDYNYVDPLFHKISGKFDDGGFKGLLLNNIEVDENLCYILYNEKLAKAKKSRFGQKDSTISDFKLLKAEFRAIVRGVDNKSICPGLAGFRKIFPEEEGMGLNSKTRSEFNFQIFGEQSNVKNEFSIFEDEESFNRIIVEQISNTQTPLNLNEEDYPVNVCEDNEFRNTPGGFVETTEVELLFDDRVEIRQSKCIFRESFNFWNYLEPESWQMSKISRTKENNKT